MATKKAPAKATTRKAAAKKANAPMKKAPAAKSAKKEVKAAASKTARATAKKTAPANRKSAAKRAEKKVVAAVSLPKQIQSADYPALKTHMNRLVKTLKDDYAAAEKGGKNEAQFRELLLSVTKAAMNAKKKQGTGLK